MVWHSEGGASLRSVRLRSLCCPLRLHPDLLVSLFCRLQRSAGVPDTRGRPFGKRLYPLFFWAPPGNGHATSCAGTMITSLCWVGLYLGLPSLASRFNISRLDLVVACANAVAGLFVTPAHLYRGRFEYANNCRFLLERPVAFRCVMSSVLKRQHWLWQRLVRRRVFPSMMARLLGGLRLLQPLPRRLRLLAHQLPRSGLLRASQLPKQPRRKQRDERRPPRPRPSRSPATPLSRP